MKSIDEMTQEEIRTELAELRRINAADGGVVDLRAQRRAEAVALLGASREPHSAADYLAAVRAACLDPWEVDTGSDGDDCILSALTADDALADVAEHARETESEAHPEGRAAWARERGWTATRIGGAS